VLDHRRRGARATVASSVSWRSSANAGAATAIPGGAAAAAVLDQRRHRRALGCLSLSNYHSL
jgi:hypothetical protein